MLPSSSCSSPGDQEEHLHSLELADEHADDNQVYWNFDQMAPIRVSLSHVKFVTFYKSKFAI